MRLWHEALIPQLPRQQLLGQHRECCALRGNGWGKPHATVNYVFDHPSEWLYAYHILVMQEMIRRGYNVGSEWVSIRYRGKSAEPYSRDSLPKMNSEVNLKLDLHRIGQPIYPEHNEEYLKECLDNLVSKGIVLEVTV